MKAVRYKGFYITKRNGKRVGIDFTYENEGGKMVNEIEEKITEIKN